MSEGIGKFFESILTIIRKANELVDLITSTRTVLSSFAKAKTAKLGIDCLLGSQNTILNQFHSPTASRPFPRHPKHNRYSNHSHKVMYRMGYL